MCRISLSQNIRSSFISLDYLRFPTISGQLCLSDSGGKTIFVDSTKLKIFQDGQELNYEIRCPRPGETLSIIQVLDNSGSMRPRMNALSIAAGILVDSMRTGDEMALVTFSNSTRLLQDFTSDKSLLKARLNAMNAFGGTAFFDALMQSLDLVAARNARAVLVAVSDGNDNMSVASLDDVILKAKTLDVVVYSVGIGATTAPQQDLIRLAIETGGRYFSGEWPSELLAIFEEISRGVFSPCCSVVFDVRSCADSVASRFRIEYQYEGRLYASDTLIALPWRPDTLRVSTDAPARLSPGQTRIVYFNLDPSVSLRIPLRFDAEIRYNKDLLELNPVRAVTVGTITQGKIVRVRESRPGIVRVTADNFMPDETKGKLFGLRFLALSGDTSRVVPLDVVSMTMKQGCENIVVTEPDSIEVCQCVEAMALAFNTSRKILTSGFVTTSVAGRIAYFSQPFIVKGEITFDSTLLEPVDIVASDGRRYAWRVVGGDTIVIDPAWFRASLSDSMLFTVTWKIIRPKYSREAFTSLFGFKLWSRCCYQYGDTVMARYLLEGSCDRIASGFPTIRLKPVFPNPANPVITVIVEVGKEKWESAENRHVTLSLFSVMGRRVDLFYDGNLSIGRNVVTHDVSSLPSGMYYLVLEAGRLRQLQPFRIVK